MNTIYKENYLHVPLTLTQGYIAKFFHHIQVSVSDSLVLYNNV